jgi:quinol monooxygenase YgiN
MLTVSIEANAPERRELVQALLTWVASTRLEEAALQVNVYEDVEAAASFCLVAKWRDRAGMEAHVRGASFGVMHGALELLARPPRASISRVGSDQAESAGAWLMIRALRDSAKGAEQHGAAADQICAKTSGD